MIFNENDIDFSKLDGTKFENLCYDLLENNNFFDLVWLKGAGDRGRDIEAKVVVHHKLLNDIVEKWHFECKNHSKGLGEEDIHGKIGWAQIHKPNKLVFLVSPHLTPDAKLYIKEARKSSYSQLFYVESEKLKKLILKTPLLVEKYFLSETKKLLINSINEYVSTGLTADERKIDFIIEDDDIFNQFDQTELAYLLYCVIENYTSSSDKWEPLIKKIVNSASKKKKSILSELVVKQIDQYGFGSLRKETITEEFPEIEGELTEEERYFVEMAQSWEANTAADYTMYTVTLQDNDQLCEYLRVRLPNEEKYLEILLNTNSGELSITTNYTKDPNDLNSLSK